MADLKPISQFNTASAVEANTLLFVSTPNQNNGYDSEKVSASELGEALVNDFMYTQDLPTVDKTITGSISEHDSVIGYNYDIYNPTTAYSKDDLCIYNNVLYKAKQATTGNLPTNTTYWEQTSIADEISRIDTALSGKANASDVDNSTASLTRHSSAPQSTPLAYIIRRGHVVIVEFVNKFSAGTYYQLYNALPLPTGQYHGIVFVGSTPNLVTILANGVIQFNNSITISADSWVIGELVYITND